MISPRLCLIEDDPIMGESLSDRFALEGFGLDWYARGDEALNALRSRSYAAVISDVRLPDISGEMIFQQANEQVVQTPPFVFITAYATVDSAVNMLKRGAADYITKPFDIGELVTKVRSLVGVASPPPAEGSSVLGISAGMRALAATAPRVAERARTVLITGESGVGKEVLAKHLHALANRGAEAPFVAINCAAVPETLLEASFFGHERGAFSGAERATKGYFEQAHSGTLFLDEIGDLPLLMQVKLLRAIQERRVQRLGSEVSVPVDVRVICATNVDLQSLVMQGKFREDLYYRINVVQLKVPPLRTRPDDVLWLAHTFLEQQGQRLTEPPKLLTPAARAALLGHAWPGNVRELLNRVERACIISSGVSLTAADLFGDLELTQAPDAAEGLLSLERFVAEAERSYIEQVVRRFGGRIAAAAAALGISRKTLWEKMKRYDLRGDDGTAK